jgi:hypothetical protein
MFMHCDVVAPKLSSEELIQLTQWEKKHTIANLLTLPIRWIKQSDGDHQARDIDQDHVAFLQSLFMKTMTCNRNIKVFMFSEIEYPHYGYIVNQDIPEVLLSELEEVLTIPYAGAHSCVAVHRLHAKYPRNPTWMQVICPLVVCKDTPENRRRLKSIGVLDNAMGEARKGLTYWDRVCTLHDDGIMVAKEAKTTNGNFRKLMSKSKDTRKSTWGLTTNSINAMWSLAKKKDRLWTLIKKVFTGDVVLGPLRPTFKKPISGHHFQFWANIDDNVLCDMLDQVVGGTYSMDWFKHECKLVKARARIVEYIKSSGQQATGRLDVDLDSVTWIEAHEEGPDGELALIPAKLDDAFVSEWELAVSQMGARHKTFPDRMVRMVSTALTAHIRAGDEAQEVIVVLYQFVCAWLTVLHDCLAQACE